MAAQRASVADSDLQGLQVRQMLACEECFESGYQVRGRVRIESGYRVQDRVDIELDAQVLQGVHVGRGQAAHMEGDVDRAEGQVICHGALQCSEYGGLRPHLRRMVTQPRKPRPRPDCKSTMGVRLTSTARRALG